MIVKAKYYKEIEVVDKITKEEIDCIPLYGMPSRFDGMADQIDNEQPLKFNYWEYVEDDKFKSSHTKPEPRMNIIIGIISAIIFGLSWGIFKQSISCGISNAVLYMLIWFSVSITINWIRKELDKKSK